MVHPKVHQYYLLLVCVLFKTYYWYPFKVAVSLSNYRKIPKGSLLDEDSDSFDDDEWDKANKSWDSFEVSL